LYSVLLVVNQGFDVRLSTHYVWMVPAAVTLFAIAAVLLLVALGRWWPRMRTPRVVVGTLVGVAVFGPLPPGALHWSARLVLAAGVGTALSRLTGRRL